MSLKKVLVVGICGPSNSGKTSLTSRLQKHFQESAHMCQDVYYHPPGDERLTWIPEVQHHNWEIFSSLDMNSMVKDVKSWKEKKLQQDHDKPSVLLVEGFTIFNFKPLSELIDKKYFLLASKEVCYERRLTRDYNPPDVPHYFEKIVWPHYLNSFEEIKNDPNIIFIDEGLSRDEIYTKVKNDIENCLQNS